MYTSHIIICIYVHILIGKLNRNDAEKLLESRPAGSYLVRLSTRIWGYTVSVKCELNNLLIY